MNIFKTSVHVHYEVWEEGYPVKWGTLCTTYNVFKSKQMVHSEILEYLANLHKVNKSNVRVLGIFKL